MKLQSLLQGNLLGFPTSGQDDWKLNKITLAFSGNIRHLERAFRDDYFKRSLNPMRFSLILSIFFFGIFFLTTTFYWISKIGSKQNKTPKEQAEIIRIVWISFFVILWGVYSILWCVDLIGFESTRRWKPYSSQIIGIPGIHPVLCGGFSWVDI